MNPEKKEVYFVSTFYNFQKIQNVQNTSDIVSSLAIKRNIIGLIILAEEGFNATVACPFEKDFLDFKNDLLQFFGLTELNFKDSHSPHPPFRQFQIKIRKEIVTANAPHLVPDLTKDNNHLTPEQWNEVLKKEKHVHVIDTRNWYETQMGTFKNALNPQIDVFTDFPKFMDTQNVKKEDKVLIFCTGGIRCEKGIMQLQEQGFNNVYHLKGGILNYLKEFPNDEFEGECFVFDHRVAVDQNLNPSQIFDLCPHCGQPAKSHITCHRCDTNQAVCDDCQKLEWKKITCSKHCAYQLELHPNRKGPKQLHPWRDTRLKGP